MIGLIIFLILLVAAWQGFYWVFVDLLAVCKPYSVPSPGGVAERCVELLSDGTLLQATGNSLLRGIAGYAAAVILGIILGLLINHFKYLQKNLKPIVLGIQTLPSVCWVPFSILWFGLSTQAILFVVVMGSAFSIAISVDNAIKNVQPIYTKAAGEGSAIPACYLSSKPSGADLRYETGMVVCLACSYGGRGHDDIDRTRADAYYGPRSGGH